MPYLFSKNEEITIAFKRVMTLTLQDALSVLSLDRGLHKEQFKQARKSLKRARAVLKLLAGSLPTALYEKEEERLKQIARTFRDVRDVHVVEEVFDRIMKRGGTQNAEKEFAFIQEKVIERGSKTVQKVFSEEKRLKEALSDLEIGIEKIEKMELKGDAWKSIQEGLKDTYRDVYEYFFEAKDQRDTEVFIGWRKAVKYLRCQLDLLSDFLSSEVRDWNKQLHVLSDLLGECQDLEMLNELICENSDELGEKKKVKQFLEVIGERQTELKESALEQAKDLFQENPKSFVRWMKTTSKNWPAAA